MDASYTGNQISTLRRQKGMTQKELAEILHVTDKAVSKWERGKNFPDLILLQPLAEVLGVSVSELLGVEPEKTNEAIAVISAISERERRSIKTSLYVFISASILASVLYLVFFALLTQAGNTFEAASFLSLLARIILTINVLLIIYGVSTLERLKKKLSLHKDFYWSPDSNMVFFDYMRSEIGLWHESHKKDSE